MIKIFYISLLALNHVNVRQTNMDDVIFHEDFEVNTEFNKALEKTHLTKIVSIHNDKKLKVYYRPTNQGTERVIVNQKIEKTNSATLEYKVTFCENFDFRKGGKLPGFGSKKPIAGGYKMDGVNWSARIMFGENGTIKSYVYHENKKQKYGSVVNADKKKFALKRGTENNIKIELIKQKKYSVLKIYLNDTLAITHDDLILGNNSHESMISTFMFNTFHGGADYSWTPKDKNGKEFVSCAYFDDITIKRNNSYSLP